MKRSRSNMESNDDSYDDPPLPPLPSLPSLPPVDEALMGAAAALISNGIPASASASTSLAQQQQQQRQESYATSTSATPATATATATATTTTTTTAANHTENKILRIIAKMFRQHADLYYKQASYLEKRALFNNSVDTTNAAHGRRPCNNNNIHMNGNNPPSPIMWDDTIPSREELQDKIRRDSVVDLAKLSYEGMKGVQNVVDAVLIKKKVQGGSTAGDKRGESNRRRFAFELFEQDILQSIGKEAKFKELMKSQNELKKEKKQKKPNRSRSSKSIDEEVNDPVAAYIFQRTQEEWKKLNKRKIVMYAKKAEGKDGIKHIELRSNSQKTKNTRRKKRATPTNNETESDSEIKPLFKRQKGDPSASGRKLDLKRRKMTPSSKKESRQILDDSEDSTDESNDNDSEQSLTQNNNIKNDNINNATNSINRINQKEEDDDKSDSDDEDGGLDLLAMPAMPQPTPIKRERDESSSSNEEDDHERKTTQAIKRERDESSSSSSEDQDEDERETTSPMRRERDESSSSDEEDDDDERKTTQSMKRESDKSSSSSSKDEDERKTTRPMRRERDEQSSSSDATS